MNVDVDGISFDASDKRPKTKETRDKRQETRDKRQETREKRRERRGKMQGTRDKRHEVRGQRRETRKPEMGVFFADPGVGIFEYEIERNICAEAHARIATTRLLPAGFATQRA